MERAFVADGDRCRVVEAPTLAAAQLKAKAAAARRGRRTDKERDLGAWIDHVFESARAS